MKTIINICIISLCIHNQVYAHGKTKIRNNDVDNIFVRVSDFKASNRTYEANKQAKAYKVRLHQFFISPNITCFENNKKVVYPKDSIFAIHLLNGESYRFINRKPYIIADTSYLYIYTCEGTKTVYKMMGHHRRAKLVPTASYYFSFGNHRQVYTLTLANLNKYVLTNPKAIAAVSDKLLTDTILTEVDVQTGVFVINELLGSLPFLGQ